MPRSVVPMNTEDPSVADEIKASIVALRGESAAEVGETFKNRFADRKDTCQVNVLVDGVLRQQTEADITGERTTLFEEPWRDMYGIKDITVAPFRGLR